MKSFIKNHQDLMLIISALAFLCSLVALYAWSMQVLLLNLNQTFGVTNGTQVSSEFDFETAKKILSEHGLND